MPRKGRDELDAKDRLILDQLRENSRIKIQRLMKLAKLTGTPIRKRIKRLENLRYIGGYTIADGRKSFDIRLKRFAQIGFEKIDETIMDEVLKRLKNHPSVVKIYLTAGTFDYLLEIEATPEDDIAKIIADIRRTHGIGRTNTIILLEQIYP